MERNEQQKLDEVSVRMARKYKDLEKSLGFGASVNLLIGYAIAFGIWAFVFRANFLWFAIGGIFVAGLIILFLLAPLFTMNRTVEHIQAVTFVVGIWEKIAVIIGVLGLVAWGIRAIFFH
jgi:hypothetical protein